MSSHPPVPTESKPSFGVARDHPLMERQVESSLPLLGDSQFELVLDPSMRVELEAELEAASAIEDEPIQREPISLEENDPVDDEVRRYHGRRTKLLVGANVVTLAAAGYFAYAEIMPLRHDLESLEDKRVVLEHELEQSHVLAISAEAQRASAEKQRGELEAQLKAKETEWAAKQAIIDEAAARLAWIPAARAEVETALAAEIKRGEVVVRSTDQQLVVELADRAVYADANPVVGDKGKALLLKVAAPLLAIPGKTLRIGGHVDAAPTGELANRYPSAWELSVARSTQVARFLIDGAQVPAERLVVEGYGASRPQASGKSAAAKKRNRRLEISVGP